MSSHIVAQKYQTVREDELDNSHNKSSEMLTNDS